MIDSQSMKTTESGGVCGYDAGKRVKGRTRHIVTDTLGLMLFAVIHGADIQDRDGAPDVPGAIRYRFPWLRHVFAGGGYAGEKPRSALKRHGDWAIEIIKRSDTANGFEVLPRRNGDRHNTTISAQTGFLTADRVVCIRGIIHSDNQIPVLPRHP